MITQAALATSLLQYLSKMDPFKHSYYEETMIKTILLLMIMLIMMMFMIMTIITIMIMIMMMVIIITMMIIIIIKKELMINMTIVNQNEELISMQSSKMIGEKPN